MDFKYPTELTQTFMSANQIGGFFNRLEASRKYLFGSVGVLGAANDSLISGTFILRGLDVLPVVDVAPDFESYEYKKLDLANADDKAFFESALAWELEIDGKKWADGKNVSASLSMQSSGHTLICLPNSSSKPCSLCCILLVYVWYMFLEISFSTIWMFVAYGVLGALLLFPLRARLLSPREALQ